MSGPDRRCGPAGFPRPGSYSSEALCADGGQSERILVLALERLRTVGHINHRPAERPVDGPARVLPPSPGSSGADARGVSRKHRRDSGGKTVNQIFRLHGVSREASAGTQAFGISLGGRRPGGDTKAGKRNRRISRTFSGARRGCAGRAGTWRWCGGNVDPFSVSFSMIFLVRERRGGLLGAHQVGDHLFTVLFDTSLAAASHARREKVLHLEHAAGRLHVLAGTARRPSFRGPPTTRATRAWSGA